MASNKKDWRNFERRREEAQRRSQFQDYYDDPYAKQPPHNTKFNSFNNFAYEADDRVAPQYLPQINPKNGKYSGDTRPISVISSNYGRQNPSTVREEVEYIDDGPIQKKRKCRDVICLGFLLASILLMLGVVFFAAFKGDLNRFKNGYDLDCDRCSMKNLPTNNFTNSGKDLSGQNYVLTLRKISPNITLDERALLSAPIISRECVASCPPQYKIYGNKCMLPSNTTAQLIDIDGNTSLNARFNLYDDNTFADVANFFDEAASDIQNSWKYVVYIALASLGVAIFVTILLRVFAGFIIWAVVALVTIGSVAGSIALWILWNSKRNDSSWNNTEINTLMSSAIFVSIITVLILITLFFIRNRIALMIKLFNEAGKAVHAMPLILLQPIYTLLALIITLSSWMIVLILIETSGSPEKDDEGLCTYKKDWFTVLSRWWNLFMVTWMTQFILGCQHMIIAGAVSTWFFTRDKKRMFFPILTSYRRLLRYHLGSVAFGSLIIAIVKMIRYILNTIQKKIGSTNAFLKGVVCCFKCCIWCLEKFLQFLNRNAYIEIAIYGYGFCKSAKKAFKVIVKNAVRMAVINSIGSFVLFLGKVAIVALSVFIGYEIIKDKDDVIHIWIPLTAGAIIAFFIAHCFITVYEMVIDTVFICFCEDSEMNNGRDKPYYMSKGLMEFVKNTEEALKTEENRKANVKRRK